MIRVAVLDDYLRGAENWADWQSLAPGTQVSFFTESIPRAELAERLAGFEVLVLMRERTAFSAEVLAELPALQLVVTTGPGNASLDVTYLHERGVVACGTEMPEPGPGIPTTAEVAWALILAVAKRVTQEDAALRAGHWQTGMPAALSGQTLGLAGLGHLGEAMLGPARAFGMDVIAWSANLTDARATEVGVTRVEKAELLARSDVLSIHLKLSKRTCGLFGAPDLARMKPTASLINTSRGPIVDEAALVRALRQKTIAAAGLDVYDREPLPAGHPLIELPNVVLLPHLGYVTEAVMETMYGQVVQDIAAWQAGSPIRTI